VIVYCATSNPGKIREFRVGAHAGIEIEPLPGLAEIAPPEENGSTFEENAITKAIAYGRYTEGWLFAEDSGLAVEALKGEPGVYSARYAGPEATDRQNNELVLDRLGDAPDRTARFICVIALVYGGCVVRTFQGTVEGEILREPLGANGFGYDPIFYYRPFGCSFAEVERDCKLSVSHRGAALAAMTAYLKTATLVGP